MNKRNVGGKGEGGEERGRVGRRGGVGMVKGINKLYQTPLTAEEEDKKQGWALRSFPFGTLRSFPF